MELEGSISVFWQTGGGPLACLFAFSCSVRHRRPSKMPQAPRAATIFGSAPSVQDRWWSSRDSGLSSYNFVLHLCSPLPHETTLHIQKTSRASPRWFALSLNKPLLPAFSVDRFATFSRTSHLPDTPWDQMCSATQFRPIQEGPGGRDIADKEGFQRSVLVSFMQEVVRQIAAAR